MQQKRPRIENPKEALEKSSGRIQLSSLLADHADIIATLPVFGGEY
jgi:hypothetical protein